MGTAACHECLVELVEADDLGATIRCRHCLKDWPARMKACPQCLAELKLDPQRASDMLSDILGRGFYIARPGPTVAFEHGPGCALLRARPQASLIFVGDDGFFEAHVEGDDHRAIPPMSCRDLDGRELFRLDHYRAAPDALVASTPDGAPLGTYLRREGVRHVLDVRDETSAPVAALRDVPGRAGGVYDLVETGGQAVGSVGYADIETDGWVDDQWTFHPLVDPALLPLRPLAAVALLLAAKVLLGRPAPTRAQRGDHLSWDGDGFYE